uniref:Uncharacterized protein n=1 Tax=Hyaloperonospora arabidopsidis (strain Emoy2) TaxID=559515 RepID=M4BQ60_HYAAE
MTRSFYGRSSDVVDKSRTLTFPTSMRFSQQSCRWICKRMKSKHVSWRTSRVSTPSLNCMGSKQCWDAHLGRTPDEVSRAKYRTKILLANLSPDMLKKDVTRIVTHEQVSAKTDEVALFKIVKKRAREHHYYHLLGSEERRARDATQGARDATSALRNQPKDPGRCAQADTKSHAVLSAPTAPATASSTPRSRSPPRDGCLVCKWMSNCKNATKEQKNADRDAQRSR